VTLCQETLNLFASDEIKEKYLIPLARGEKIGAFALTEPNAGTDAASIETTARLSGDKWVLNGRKFFITNGPVADIFVVFAMTDRSMGARGMSAFVVPRNTLGFKVGKVFSKMGIWASPTAELILEDVHIPKENLINDEGEGFKIAMKILDLGRIGIAAQAVGIAQAALEYSIRHATRREQFGRPISNLQAIQWMVAEMASRIESARLLTYRAAYCAETQEVFSKEASMAKLMASDTAVDVTRYAIQIHGGYGYMKDLPLERFYRDAKITEIYEGTSEVQKMVIANALMR
jgi:butyryl-CoA dehydrogenase